MRLSILICVASIFCQSFGSHSTAADETSGKKNIGGKKLEFVENSIGMRFVRIPPGEFLMGSPDTEPFRFNSEQQHRVKITQEFWLSIEEVTKFQYRRVTGASPVVEHEHNVVANNISWYQADDFCRNLSELDSEKRAGNTYRLPTEAEWEYACRAGTQTAYSWGDDPEQAVEYSWCLKNIQQESRRVGSLKPNPWGLYDMHGNCWEWCSDWYADLPAEPQVDPKGPAIGEEKVIRGGADNSNAGYLRSASRVPYGPSFSNKSQGRNIGIRLVLVPNTEQQTEKK